MKLTSFIFGFLLLTFSNIVGAITTERTSSYFDSTFTDGCIRCVNAQAFRDLSASTLAGHATGSLNYENFGAGTTINITSTSNGVNNFFPVSIPSTVYHSHQVDNGGSDNGTLRYTGLITKHFHIAITISGSPATNSDMFVAGLSKNGVLEPYCKVIQRFGTTTDTQVMTYHCDVDLNTNDLITPVVGNLTGSRNIVIKTVNMFVMGFQH